MLFRNDICEESLYCTFRNFREGLFSRNFAFVEMLPSRNGEIISPFIDKVFNVSFNAICENKVLAKISEFTSCA